MRNVKYYSLLLSISLLTSLKAQEQDFIPPLDYFERDLDTLNIQSTRNNFVFLSRHSGSRGHTWAQVFAEFNGSIGEIYGTRVVYRKKGVNPLTPLTCFNGNIVGHSKKDIRYKYPATTAGKAYFFTIEGLESGPQGVTYEALMCKQYMRSLNAAEKRAYASQRKDYILDYTPITSFNSTIGQVYNPGTFTTLPLSLSLKKEGGFFKFNLRTAPRGQYVIESTEDLSGQWSPVEFSNEELSSELIFAGSEEPYNIVSSHPATELIASRVMSATVDTKKKFFRLMGDASPPFPETRACSWMWPVNRCPLSSSPISILNPIELSPMASYLVNLGLFDSAIH